jgi:putative hydrolase of HD superfamily
MDPTVAVDRLLALLCLDALPRTGWLQAGIGRPESVAAHSLGAALLALTAGAGVEPPLDLDRCLALLVVHDAPEALLGDWPRAAAELLPAGAKAAAERGAAERLLGDRGPARQRYEEYAAGTTREARFARACDKLHLALRALGYVRAGARGLQGFFEGAARLDCAEFPPLAALRDELLRRAAIPSAGA